jgi:hypothetical protein
VAALSIGLLCTSAHALQVECLEVKDGSIIDAELRSASDFQNCFYIEGASISSLKIVSVATPGLSHRITYSTIDQVGTLTKLSEAVSNSDSSAVASVVPSGRKIAFSFLPTNALSTNKIISIGYAVKDDAAVVVINALNVSAPFYTPPPEGCVVRLGVQCSNKTPIPPSTSFQKGLTLSATSTASASSCSSGKGQPSGKPSNFDIDEHLAKFDAFRKSTEEFGPFDKAIARGTMITMAFYINRPYDLTVNPKYPGASSQFVNYFYGMAAQRLGYSEQTALTAGAIVQQVQNYKNSAGSAVPISTGEMIRNIAFAAISGLGDNPGDAANISAGFKDAQACTPPSSPPPSVPGSGNDAPGGGISAPGGWSGGSISPPAGCTGSCGSNILVNVSIPIPFQTSK